MNVNIALACAARGWRVFPVSIVYGRGGKTEKRPLVAWKEEASSDPAGVRALWSAYPVAKVGIVTGAESGVYVVDVDRPDALTEQLGETHADRLAGSYAVATNREGGVHHYFAAPEDGLPVPNSQEHGLDVRGDGGMVVLWHDLPGDLLPLPQELADWARDRASIKPANEASTSFEVIRWPGGGSDAWVVSMVGGMCRQGWQETAALAALLAENEAGRFDPACDVEWLAMKVHGVYERYYRPSQAVSSALLSALSRLQESRP